MKTQAVLSIVFLCAYGIMAGSAGEDSLVIAAAIDHPPGQTDGGAPPRHAGRKISALGLARNVYQKFISSQDGGTCCFSISCSNFCVTAVREKGVIRGTLLTADRLTRCNGIQADRYTIDFLSGKNVDDVLPGPVK